MKKYFILIVSALMASAFFMSGCIDEGGNSVVQECSAEKGCADKTKECKEGKCVPKGGVESECSAQKPCSDNTKECKAGKCVFKTIEFECSLEKPCVDTTKRCILGECVPNRGVEPECSLEKPCADKTKRCILGECVQISINRECSSENPCGDVTKVCIAGKCVSKVDLECSSENPCVDNTKDCRDSKCVAKLPDTWIGKPCTCIDEEGCNINFFLFKIPNPYSDKIKGCEAGNTDEKGGGKVMCLRDLDFSFFEESSKLEIPKGYCSLGASDVKLISNKQNLNSIMQELLKAFTAGNIHSFNQCPAGALYMGIIVKKKEYRAETGEQVTTDIKVKICMRECNTDEDCRVVDDYKCILVPEIPDSEEGVTFIKPEPGKKICIPKKLSDDIELNQ